MSANPSVADGDGSAQVADGDSGPGVAALIASRTLDVPDFPQPGIVFKDLSPLLADGGAMHSAVGVLVDAFGSGSFDVVAGVEARGFVLAGAIAYATGTGVVTVRKAGKLPRATYSASYALEYGTATLEVHADAFVAGQRVLVVDDVLATGGTAEASLQLIERAGGTPIGLAVLIELGFLGGRQRLGGRRLHALWRL